MSPELERLLAALWERNTCEPQLRPRWDATFRRLVDEALHRQPGLGREQLMAALWPRFEEYRRARRRPPTLPPKA
jgi:hypothetical protein